MKLLALVITFIASPSIAQGAPTAAPAPAATQMDFTKMKTMMAPNIKSELDKAVQQKWCLEAKTVPAAQAATCENAKKEVIVSLDSKVKMLQAQTACLNSSADLPKFQECTRAAIMKLAPPPPSAKK